MSGTMERALLKSLKAMVEFCANGDGPGAYSRLMAEAKAVIAMAETAATDAPNVTLEMEEAGREWARTHDPSTFADIFNAMWRARPLPSPPPAPPDRHSARQ